MENRSRTYVALDALTAHSQLGVADELIQPIEIIPFDDREYQLQARLTTTFEESASGWNLAAAGRVHTEIDHRKVMDAVTSIRVDERLGVEAEIIYPVHHLSLKGKHYELQVVMTSTRIDRDVPTS